MCPCPPHDISRPISAGINGVLSNATTATKEPKTEPKSGGVSYKAYCATAHSSRLHRKISFSRRKLQGIIIPKDALVMISGATQNFFSTCCEMHAPFIISVTTKSKRTCPLAPNIIIGIPARYKAIAIANVVF